MTTFHTREAPCPNCQTMVKVNILTSTNTFGGRYSDFRQDAVGFQPRMLVMALCQVCGFAGYSHEFKVENVLPDRVRELIAERIYPTIQDGGVPVSKMYEIHAQISAWLGGSSVKIADNYLKAAWSCQDEGDIEREREYRRIAISYFKDALTNRVVEKESEPSITYLVGELYRRTGDIEQAHYWFNTVIEQAKIHAHWGRLADLAERQRDDPKDVL